jgi:hypothetical protein
VKSKGLTISSQAEPIDLNNPPQMQWEVGQLNQQPFSSFTHEKDILLVMDSLYMGHL